MKTRIWIPILFLVLLAGCRTTKQTEKSKSEVKTELNADVKTESETEAATETKTGAVDKAVTTNNTSTKTTITDFSAPDANGKQHPTRQTVIEQTNNNKTIAESKVNSDSKTKAKSKEKNTDKSDYKSDKSAKTDNSITEQTKTPSWVYVGVLVLLVGIYIAFKRVLK